MHHSNLARHGMQKINAKKFASLYEVICQPLVNMILPFATDEKGQNQWLPHRSFKEGWPFVFSKSHIMMA